ncbi:hypothetical protein [Nonomuraea sp. NPDC049141]|uniref:hypothetical protein n=1 Tax=unclassified Nonomuraea TaxID=2593643 RepID=UPI0033CA6098
MREPQPTAEDEWSAWENLPIREYYWPGLELEHSSGYEVGHGRLQTIGKQLMTQFDEVYRLLHRRFESAKMTGGILGWKAAITVSDCITGFEEALSCLTGDAMMECAMAAGLVSTSGRSYQLAEVDSWRAKPDAWATIPEESWSPKGHYWVSNAYPNGSISPRILKANVGDPVTELITDDTSHHGLNRAQIREMLMSWKPNLLTDYASATTAIANGLVEVAHGIVFRAQEIRDAPWHGPAADKAQEALKSIYETVRGLASVHGDMGLRTTECAEILISAQHRFDAVVNKGGWELSDLWSGDDKDAAEFMTGVNRQLGDVMRQLPGAAQLGLPGLIPESERAIYSLAWY